MTIVPSSEDPSLSDSTVSLSRRRRRMLECGVVVLVFGVHLVGIQNGFVNWDDPAYVRNNMMLRSPGGLLAIWQGQHEEQYYPLTFTSYWLEANYLGDTPRVYHATNIVLHAINTWLVMLAARSLGLGGWLPALAGLLYGLHPVQVASVAWITERKNTLSALFYLLTLLAYRSYRRTDRGYLLLLSTMLFIPALLSKTAVVTLPVSLWLADVLIDRRPARKSLLPIVPMLLCGALAGVLTIHMENRAVFTPLFWPLRPLVAAGAIWFYLGKVLMPVNLAVVYPRWTVSLTTVWLWLALVALALAGGAIWRWRNRIGGPAVWGVLHFTIALLPMLGLLPFGYFSHSFVADHFVYHAMVGALVSIAFLVGRCVCLVARRGILCVPAVVVSVTLFLSVQTVRQTRVWRDSISLWEATLARNPGFALGRNNLGSALLEADRVEDAVVQLSEAIRLNPLLSAAHANLGMALLHASSPLEAEPSLRKALELDPTIPKARQMLGVLMQQRGDYAGALNEFRTAQKYGGDDPSILNNLALLLATSPDPSLRNLQEAEMYAQQAVVLSQYGDPVILNTLAITLAESGRYREALLPLRLAVEKAREMCPELVPELERKIRQCQQQAAKMP